MKIKVHGFDDIKRKTFRGKKANKVETFFGMLLQLGFKAKLKV